MTHENDLIRRGEDAPHANETPKSEHASADVLTTPPAPWVKDHAAPKEPTK